MANDVKKDHPVGESVGAAGGAVTGMTVGAAVGGPAGAVVGAAVGAVAGGVAGHGVAAAIDPAVEDAYWRENYRNRPYVRAGSDYDNTYRDAYRYGWESRAKGNATWNDTADDLERGWDSAKGNSRLAWHEAKDAVRDGWHRVERAMPATPTATAADTGAGVASALRPVSYTRQPPMNQERAPSDQVHANGASPIRSWLTLWHRHAPKPACRPALTPTRFSRARRPAPGSSCRSASSPLRRWSGCSTSAGPCCYPSSCRSSSSTPWIPSWTAWSRGERRDPGLGTGGRPRCRRDCGRRSRPLASVRDRGHANARGRPATQSLAAGGAVGDERRLGVGQDAGRGQGDRRGRRRIVPRPVAPRGTLRVEVADTWRASDARWAGGLGMLGLVGQAVSMLFLTIFLLVEDDAFKRKLVRRMESIGSKRVTVQVLKDIAHKIEQFLWVQALTSAGVAVATGLGLWWMGVENPAVWGVFAGLMNLVPLFGPLIVTVVIGAVAFLQFGSIRQASLVAGMTIVITTLEGNFITPQLLSRKSSLNLVAIFIAITFWSWVWGVAGMLLAVPILMAVKVVCDRVEGGEGLAEFLGTSPETPGAASGDTSSEQQAVRAGG